MRWLAASVVHQAETSGFILTALRRVCDDIFFVRLLGNTLISRFSHILERMCRLGLNIKLTVHLVGSTKNSPKKDKNI